MKNENEPETDKNMFNKTAMFKTEVKDDLLDNRAFSGIDEVWCIVQKDSNIITEECLYKWNEKEENTLRRSYSKLFELDPKKVPEYNQDNLDVFIFVKDRAGNEYGDTKVESQVSMNVDKLECNVTFEDEFNENRSDENYFTSRTARIEIRNDR